MDMNGIERKRIKTVMMTYLHDDGSRYEPVVLAMLRMRETHFLAARTRNGGAVRGSRSESTWHKVFEDLAMILSPMQLEQLAERISKDFRGTCDLFLGLARSQGFTAPEVGGEG